MLKLSVDNVEMECCLEMWKLSVVYVEIECWLCGN